jgi:glycerol-3-phosphate acyltransferase PlsY
MIVVWVVLAFLSGGLPFSVWIGRLALRTDIRGVGDGNPGATNVWKVGGAFWGILAIVLDFAKGAVPVVAGNFWLGLDGGALTAVALAPILGHAYSPFLGFRGGKALAVTFGIWTGLTVWFAPTVLGLAFALWLILLKKDAMTVMLGLVTLLIALLLFMPNPVYVWVWVGNFMILGWKHLNLSATAIIASAAGRW